MDELPLRRRNRYDINIGVLAEDAAAPQSVSAAALFVDASMKPALASDSK
jgi:hypothetical protein